jgi:hypothetical protein
MFVKITTSGPRQYVKLVEAYRDSAGFARQRVIATLGRLEAVQAGESDALVNGLLRATGRPTLEDGTGELDFAPARSVGDTWLLTALWKDLGFADAFRRVLRNKRQFDAEGLLRLMVFNRLCDPESKLGLLRWLEGCGCLRWIRLRSVTSTCCAPWTPWTTVPTHSNPPSPGCCVRLSIKPCRWCSTT